MLLPERLAGAVWGHLVGDALGVPYEFTPADAIGEVTWRGHGTYDRPPGTWSDDGALMLSLLDSLLSIGWDLDDQGQRAVAWWRQGRYAVGGHVFDIGISTSAALGHIESGTRAADAGAVDALGNGSLMRILPIALVYRDADDEDLIDRAVRASRVTHGSAEAQIACAWYTLIARDLLRGKTDRAAALERARDTLVDALARISLPGSREAAGPDDAVAALQAFAAWSDRRGSGRVVDSFWSAWDAFVGADSYESTVIRAVRYGNDTDTTACIAGGLAGIHWGIGAIPGEWRRGLRDRHVPTGLVDRLVETERGRDDKPEWRTSSSSPLRVDEIHLEGTGLGDGAGRIGITFLPGKRYVGTWTGPHWRDLDADAARLRELGFDVLLLLVEDHELEDCRVTDIAEVVAEHEVELVRFPIVDPTLPADPLAYRATLAGLLERVRDGASVAIACRGGLDRGGMTAACFLREAGIDADEAIDRVHRAREHSLTIRQQQAFVRAWPPTSRM